MAKKRKEGSKVKERNSEPNKKEQAEILKMTAAIASGKANGFIFIGQAKRDANGLGIDGKAFIHNVSKMEVLTTITRSLNMNPMEVLLAGLKNK